MPQKGRSRIFYGSRVLGYVSTHVPVVTRFVKRRGENLFVTSIGKWFHTYGCEKFRLLSVSGEHPGPITCLAGDTYHVYTASECTIYAWRRGCEIKHTYSGHNAPIHLMLPFGPHLIAIDEENTLKVWDIKNESLFLELEFDENIFKITTLTHPPTYINKILLGSQQGQLQLRNLRTSKLIHTFKGWGSPITVVEAAPALDVVAIALASGKIVIHNLRYDETVMEFFHDWGMVSSISFRMDGVPVMVTGSTEGHIVLWDLEEKRVMSQIEGAHRSSVSGMQCLTSEPLMVTNSGDNSLKLWIFDMPDGGGRLLKKREGHSEAPNLVQHCEPRGENLLSAGADSSLHIMNTVSEVFNKSMGRATYLKKPSARKKKRFNDNALIMPPIIKLSSCMQRDKRWDSIATLHDGKYVGTTWSYNKISIGAHKLKPSGFEKGVQATCLTVTHCGNFAVIGYSNGQVHKFNMQSGIHRGHFGQKNRLAHKGSVRGVETDIYSQKVITAGADSRLRFWNFKQETTPYAVLRLEEPVSMTKCHRESGLLALCNEDFTITLVDIDTANIVRKLEGHDGKINDATFDAESRWLITCSMDCTIATWDIPSSRLVDIYKVDEPCTSVSMSPTGDYLATTHTGELGVFLWANKLLYHKVHLKPISKEEQVPTLKLPSTQKEKPDIDDLGVLDLGDVEYKSPEQLGRDLITLSGQPTSRWLNLLHLDIIKRRNKPKVPVETPKSAPFFLPTIPSLDLQFDLEKDDNESKSTKLLIPETFTTLTVFGKALNRCQSDAEYEECSSKLVSCSPSAIEIEVLNMAPDAGGGIEIMEKFLEMINIMLKTNKNFELAQSYLSLFLKTHTKVISENENLTEVLNKIEDSCTQAWSRLQNSLFYNICVVKSLKDV